MQKIVVIIQARFGSKRLPGKMIANLGGISVLEWVLRRVKSATKVDDIVLATSDHSRDDKVVKFACSNAVKVYRGSEYDVLSRFIEASIYLQADVVVRICADNPFVDPDEIDRLIEFFKLNDCDYASNHLDWLQSGYADGFGAEIMYTSILQKVKDLIVEPHYREHVTLFIREHPELFEVKALKAPEAIAYPKLRFDLDTSQDLNYLKRLVSNGVNVNSKAKEIVSIALKELE
jgi:spore coat polysaccharide biosynthesis protein SpsF